MVEAKGCDGRGRGGNTWCLRRTRDYDPQFQGNIGIEIKYYLPDLHLSVATGRVAFS